MRKLELMPLSCCKVAESSPDIYSTRICEGDVCIESCNMKNVDCLSICSPVLFNFQLFWFLIVLSTSECH